ncbi:MAG: high frequency lysogenization protein HflD [Gammaproteobacteria bacterium]
MSHSLSDRVLALAGIVQAAELVNTAATGGQPDELCVHATLISIVKTEARNVPEVFGGVRGLGCGLQRLAGLLGQSGQPGDATVLRYALTLMQLQGKVLRRRPLKQVLEAGVERARSQLEHFEPTHSNVLANLADIYLHSAGAVSPRILVTGDAAQLQNPRVVNLVRSLLLGGLRAAVLWRQCGGSRWMLLFTRTHLRREAERLFAASSRSA